MSELSEYVRQLLDKGYSPDYVKKYLKQYGYEPAQVENVVAKVSTVRHEHHLGGSVWAFAALIILIAVGSVYAVLQLTGMIGGEALLDVETEPRFTEVPAGEEIGFNLKITNMGTAERFDITMEYEVLADDIVLRSREETIAISTSTTRYKKIRVPNEPGDYTLRAMATYEGKEASSSFTFTVPGEEEPDEVEKPTNKSVDAPEKLSEARDLAETQPSKAEDICMQLEKTNRDDCLSIVVKESRRPEFCDNIQAAQTRDNCYMTFIIEGQTHLCSEIDLESNQDYCDRVRDVQIMAKYYQN